MRRPYLATSAARSASGWRSSAFVMMVLVGLAVDLGGQVHAKQRAHDIAAEAARTGGEQVQAAPAIEGRYVSGRHRRRPARPPRTTSRPQASPAP